jgi:hypothetical protein
VPVPFLVSAVSRYISMTMGAEVMGGGGVSATQDRFAGHVGYRARRGGEPGGTDAELNPHGPEPSPGSELGPRNGAPRPSLTELDALAEPAMPVAWLDRSSGALIDHPLLKGLLLELPPKGTSPAADWLDRWFEAARSILELLYVQDTKRH